MIGNLTRTDVDNMARDLRSRAIELMRDATTFKSLIDSANAAGALTDPAVGYTPASADLTNIVGMADQYGLLAQVFAGNATVPTATNFDNYGANIPPVWPNVRR